MRAWYCLMNQQYLFSLPHIRLIDSLENIFSTSTNEYVPSIQVAWWNNHYAWLAPSIWAETRGKYFRVWVERSVVFRTAWHFQVAVGNRIMSIQVMNGWKRWSQGRERTSTRVFGSVVCKEQRHFKRKAAKTQHLRRRKTRTCHNKRTAFRVSHKRPELWATVA